VAAVAWCALAGAVALHGVRNLDDAGIWYDEAMQIHTSLAIHPMAAPFTPRWTLREVVARNAEDQLDPGAFGLLLHLWMRALGTSVVDLRLLSALLTLCGLAALAAMTWRWIRHPLAPPAAVALALLDPMVREQALEVRPYAFEMATTWIAMWAADLLLERASWPRAIQLGAVLTLLVGSRYSAFFTGAAIAVAVIAHLVTLRRREGDRRAPALLAVILLPSVAALALIWRYAVPGLVHRSTWYDGVLVSYLRPLTARSLTVVEAGLRALRNLAHPAMIATTTAAVLALRPARRSTAAPAAATLFVRRVALLVVMMTVALWWWHPWDPSTKWSLYLHLTSIVCVVRFAADTLPAIARRPVGRRAAAAAAIALVAAAVWVTPGVRRGHPDTAMPALLRVQELLAPERGERRPGVVAVDLHPTPVVRYLYEFGPLRGRSEYPGAFLLPRGAVPIREQALSSARWLVSFDPVAQLEQRYPRLRFTPDPDAPHLLEIAPRTQPPEP
jgi:hypothetical protein